MNTDLITYYRDRASEYEKIYLREDRQDDLQKAMLIFKELFKDRNVLEIACGTGYWTERIAETAHSILATDINEAVIEIAKMKGYPGNNVTFETADIYSYHPPRDFDSLFGGFILSHIPLQELDRFFDTINSFVPEGGLIVLMDNIYVEGSSLPIAESDSYGNTYQLRKLEDGTEHLVLKNFFTNEFLKEKISGKAAGIGFLDTQYYWILVYKNAGEKRL